MVDKKQLVEYISFADAHESYTSETAEEIYSELFEQEKFSEPDYILLQGGPNQKEETQRFKAFRHLIQATENIPHVITTESYKKRINNSEISENDLIYEKIVPESTMDEINQINQRLSGNDSVIAVTSDYHVPRTEEIMNEEISEENNYLVLGAQLSENEHEYSSKWNSEAIRTFLPQKLKDIGKKYFR